MSFKQIELRKGEENAERKTIFSGYGKHHTREAWRRKGSDRSKRHKEVFKMRL